MGSYRSVPGLLLAIESLLKARLPVELGLASPVMGAVQLLSSADLKAIKDPGTGSLLGLWLHRISVDPTCRNAWQRPPPGSLLAARPVLPLNLHLMMMSWGNSVGAEIGLHTWGMQQLATTPVLDGSLVGASDPDWGDDEEVQIAPEEVPTEDLMRIWDALPVKYTLTTCWVVRTARVVMDRDDGAGLARTRVFPVEAR